MNILSFSLENGKIRKMYFSRDQGADSMGRGDFAIIFSENGKGDARMERMLGEERESGCAVRRYPMPGLVYTYRLLYTVGGYPYIEVSAEDKCGIRREKSGLFPPDGQLARDFLFLLVRCEVSPYSLVAIYDDFLTHHLQ